MFLYIPHFLSISGWLCTERLRRAPEKSKFGPSDHNKRLPPARTSTGPKTFHQSKSLAFQKGWWNLKTPRYRYSKAPDPQKRPLASGTPDMGVPHIRGPNTDALFLRTLTKDPSIDRNSHPHILQYYTVLYYTILYHAALYYILPSGAPNLYGDSHCPCRRHGSGCRRLEAPVRLGSAELSAELLAAIKGPQKETTGIVPVGSYHTPVLGT